MIAPNKLSETPQNLMVELPSGMILMASEGAGAEELPNAHIIRADGTIAAAVVVEPTGTAELRIFDLQGRTRARIDLDPAGRAQALAVHADGSIAFTISPDHTNPPADAAEPTKPIEP